MERPDGTYPKRFRKAVRLVMAASGKRTLPGTCTPAFLPSLRTAETVGYYYPDRPDLARAAVLLHAVRDGDLSLKKVRKEIGDETAVLVASALPPASERRGGAAGDDWRTPRAALLAADPDPDALRLLAASAHEALGRLERDLGHPWIGAEGWARLDVGRDDALWYARELIASARRSGIGEDFLVGALAARLERLAAHG